MEKPPVLPTAVASASFLLIGYIVLVMWVAGDQPLDALDRFLAAFLGVMLIPLATAAITSLVREFWS